MNGVCRSFALIAHVIDASRRVSYTQFYWNMQRYTHMVQNGTELE